MFLLHLECTAEEKDRLLADLWELGTVGVTEEDSPAGTGHLAAFFEQEFDTLPLSAYSPRWETVEDHDWIAESQSVWTSVAVGSRFFLVPAWSQEPTPPGRLRLEMIPGQAFGTGWHATSQLCLEAMERHVTPGASFLDVGTGSGILSVAAGMLGVSRIIACDIDPTSAAVAHQRLAEEGIRAGVFVGSARGLRAASFDLIVANINAETLIDLGPDIARLRKPGARMILSGFPERDLARVRAVFPSTEIQERDGWFALVC